MLNSQKETQYLHIMPLKFLSILTLIQCLILVSAPSHARLYKWIDESGQIRYGDQLPPGYKNKKHQQLDAEGRIIFIKEDGKSEKQIKKERADKLAKENAEKQARQLAEEKRKKQLAQDRILLLTFNSADEIFYARDQRLLVIDSKINLLNKSINKHQSKLETLEALATKNFRSKDQPVPGSLLQKIEQSQKNILIAEEKIARSELKRTEVITNSDNNLARFKDLKRRLREQENDNKE